MKIAVVSWWTNSKLGEVRKSFTKEVTFVGAESWTMRGSWPGAEGRKAAQAEWTARSKPWSQASQVYQKYHGWGWCFLKMQIPALVQIYLESETHGQGLRILASIHMYSCASYSLKTMGMEGRQEFLDIPRKQPVLQWNVEILQALPGRQ